MTTNTPVSVMALRWSDVWHGNFDQWFMTTGLHIVLLLIGGVLAGRLVTWVSRKVSWRLAADDTADDAFMRSEATKHRQAVASVISWVSIVIISVYVGLEIIDTLQLPVNLLAGPAAVLGAALGFGARGVIEDLLAGFLIIAEKQYGFGDLVRLEMSSTAVAEGTVEDVTLRVTKLRSSAGEVYTVSNGKVVKATNMSKDWARAVIEIPVPTSADLNLVNDVLHQVCDHAQDDKELQAVLLDAPSLMGVEAIEVDTVNLRMVARTLPGKQFEAGRRLRVLVVRALGRAGVVTATDARPTVGAIASGAEDEVQGPGR